MKLVCGARFKFWDQVLVEASGLLGFGMNQQAAAADLSTDRGGAEDNVLQQARAEAVALMCCVDAKPSQQRDWLWVATAAFEQASWCVGSVNMRHGPGVVGTNGVAVNGGGYEDSCIPGSHGLTRIVNQPMSLLDGTAKECV